MTGFDVYKYVKERHPDKKEHILSGAELADLVRGCNETIRASCGELRRFSDKAVTGALVDFVRDGGFLETSCGKYISAGDDDGNRFLSAFAKNELLGSEKYTAYVNYSAATPVENVALGVTHAIIFDEGKAIFVERPHGCKTDEYVDHEGLLIYDDPELAKFLTGFLWPNDDYRDITEMDDDYISGVTLKDDDARWAAEPFCTFESENEFLECLDGYMNAAFTGEV